MDIGARPPVVASGTPAGDLARLVCENCWAHFRSWSAWDGIQVHVEDDVTWSAAPIPHVFFNQAYGARFALKDADRRIAAIVAQARDNAVPMIWRVGPDSEPRDLGRRLERSGLVFADEGLAMAMDLRDLDGAPSPGITVEPVRDDAALMLWTEIGVEGFGFPEFSTMPVFALHKALGLGADAPHQHYIARIDGEAVGMATLTTHCGVAALQNLATREAARRSGVGTALVRHAMCEGRERGLEVGVLQASLLGQGVYRRVGFHEVGRVQEYLLDAHPDEPRGAIP